MSMFSGWDDFNITYNGFENLQSVLFKDALEKKNPPVFYFYTVRHVRKVAIQDEASEIQFVLGPTCQSSSWIIHLTTVSIY